MRKTIMKQIEGIQTSRGSRKSTIDNPLLFIMYLPTHTRNNTINLLQKTFKKFLETHNLWTDYNIEYSNSTDDTGTVKEEYNEYIQTIMNKTKEGYYTDDKPGEKKNYKGCILLLGNKGSVGITYKDCDATISLDDGHHLDNQKQRFSRALTEAEGKTIGINVDMNIQRTYRYLIDIIQKHRRNTKTTKTNAEILYYLFVHNIFLFDPQQINNGKMTTIEINSYYQKEAENIMKEIDDTPFLENIECNDDLHHVIMTNFQKRELKKINSDLEGEQQDCPKGDKTKIEIDAPYVADDLEKEKQEEETAKAELLINQTYEMCKSFLFPLLALISRSYNMFDFKEIFVNDKTMILMISLLLDKKIDLDDNNYIILVNIMNHIIDHNVEIINNIREIYMIAHPNKLRQLIANHFIPTNDEKKKNAEVSTPVILVDDMLITISEDFWKTPNKVFEPCCGKGNIVLGIFDRFYKGLEEMYPDENDRCRVIMTECIYYADLTALNVFITTEIMKCHIQSYCGLDEFDYEFNSYTGNSLTFDFRSHWNIDGFDAVIGNPPYNIAKEDTLKGGYGNRSLWDKFVIFGIDICLNKHGLLLFVHPPSWRKPEHYLWKKMTQENQLIYLKSFSKKEGNKIFGCSTLFDYYLLEKTSVYKNTIIDGQDKKQYSINLESWKFLPSGYFDIIENILGDNSVIYSSSIYDTRRKWVLPLIKKEPQEEYYKRCKEEKYNYPVIHNMTKAYGNGYVYSNEDKGHYGIKKVVLSFGEFQYPYNDYEGKYGMSQICYGLQIENKEEGDNICKAINSEKFKEILKYTKWSTFQTDWRMFKYFKKDFWKEFI